MKRQIQRQLPCFGNLQAQAGARPVWLKLFTGKAYEASFNRSDMKISRVNL
jgi:hypothetical protein